MLQDPSSRYFLFDRSFVSDLDCLRHNSTVFDFEAKVFVDWHYWIAIDILISRDSVVLASQAYDARFLPIDFQSVAYAPCFCYF